VPSQISDPSPILQLFRPGGELVGLHQDYLSRPSPTTAGWPDVCGGEPCIVRTRIPVWLLVQARHLGSSDADLLRAYPTLRAEDLANAWAYSRAHTDEIEQQIRENEAA
jgi:uncharacterized protein (DUF433 family)